MGKHKSKNKKKNHKKAAKKAIASVHNLTKDLLGFKESEADTTVVKPTVAVSDSTDSPPLRRARMGESVKLAEKVARTGELTEKDLAKAPKQLGFFATLRKLREKARAKKKKKKEEKE